MADFDKLLRSYVWIVPGEWAGLTEQAETLLRAAERFRVDANSIHSYRQYRKLPKLRNK